MDPAAARNKAELSPRSCLSRSRRGRPRAGMRGVVSTEFALGWVAQRDIAVRTVYSNGSSMVGIQPWIPETDLSEESAARCVAPGSQECLLLLSPGLLGMGVSGAGVSAEQGSGTNCALQLGQGEDTLYYGQHQA